MPAVTRKRGTSAKGPADSETPIDLVSPSMESSRAVLPPTPASDQPSAKRQKNPRSKHAADEVVEAAQATSRSRGKRPASAEVIQVGAATSAPAAGSTEQAKATQQPPWKKQRGVKRVMAEFRSISQNPGAQLSHLEMVNDNALKW